MDSISYCYIQENLPVHVYTHTPALLPDSLHLTCRPPGEGCPWPTPSPLTASSSFPQLGLGNLVPPRRGYVKTRQTTRGQIQESSSVRKREVNSDLGTWEIFGAEGHQAGGAGRMRHMSQKCLREGKLSKSLGIQKFKGRFVWGYSTSPHRTGI